MRHAEKVLLEIYQNKVPSLLTEAVTYQVPASPNYWMADFYMLSFISTIDFDALLKPSLKAPQGITSAIRGERYQADIRYAEETLYPFLKKEILKDTFFSIVCESAHGLSLVHQSNWLRQHYPTWVRELARKGRAEYLGDDDEEEKYQERYYYITTRLKELGITTETYVRFCESIFNLKEGDDPESLGWDEGYGGKAWADICEAWFNLARAEDLSTQAVYIDRMYDLQHNNGSVFNKVKRYSLEATGYQWIAALLDFKATVKNPFNLLQRCSSLMQKLASPVLLAAGYTRTGLDNPNELYHAKKVEAWFDRESIIEYWTDREGRYNRGNDLPAYIKRDVNEKNFIPGESLGTSTWYRHGKQYREGDLKPSFISVADHGRYIGRTDGYNENAPLNSVVSKKEDGKWKIIVVFPREEVERYASTDQERQALVNKYDAKYNLTQRLNTPEKPVN